MNYVDNGNTGILTFEMLGKFLYYIGVLRILFNPTYGVEIDRNGLFRNKKSINLNEEFEKRKMKESIVLTQLWKLLSSDHRDYVEKETALTLIKLIYEPDASISKVIEVVKRM